MIRSIRSLALGLTVVFASGCFGSFPVVHKVYEFNKSFGSKIVQTLVFWAFSILPVYGIAGLADVLIFNLIEFWTGGGGNEIKRAELEDGSTLEMQKVSATEMRLRHYAAADGKLLSETVLLRTGENTLEIVRDGVVVSSAEQLPDGSLRLQQSGREVIVPVEQLREIGARVEQEGNLSAARAAVAPCAVAMR